MTIRGCFYTQNASFHQAVNAGTQIFTSFSHLLALSSVALIFSQEGAVLAAAEICLFIKGSVIMKHACNLNRVSVECPKMTSMCQMF